MSKLLSALVGVSIFGLLGTANAAELVILTAAEMDSVTAGAVDERFLGHFTTTTGEPALDIQLSTRPFAKEDEVRVLLSKAWGGPGEGDFVGGIAANGQLLSTGTFKYCTLFGGCSNWVGNLTAVISDNKFKGGYELSPVSGPGTIIGGIFEGRPSGTQKGSLDLQKFVPVYKG
jgi:hypothetical protein